MEEGYGDYDTPLVEGEEEGDGDDINIPSGIEIKEPSTQDIIKELRVTKEPDTFILMKGTNTRPNYIKMDGTFQRIGDPSDGPTCLDLRAILVMVYKDGRETIENVYREAFAMRPDSREIRWVQHSQYINRRVIDAPVSWRITMSATSVEGADALIRLIIKTTLRSKSKKQIKYLKKKFNRKRSIQTSLITYYPNSERLRLAQSDITANVKSKRKRNIYLFKRRFEVYMLGRESDTTIVFTTNNKTRRVRQLSMLLSSTADESGDGALLSLYVYRGNPDIIQPGETSRIRFLGQVNTCPSMKGAKDAYKKIFTKNLILSPYDSIVMSYDKDSKSLVYATIMIYFSKKVLEKSNPEVAQDVGTII